jgi:hypothetical protein
VRESRRQWPGIPGLFHFFDFLLSIFQNLCHTVLLEDEGRRSAALKNEGLMVDGRFPSQSASLPRVVGFYVRARFARPRRTKKKRPWGRRKSLKRLDSDKEIRVNAAAFLWPGLAGFGWIWPDLAKFGSGLEFPWAYPRA